MKRISIISLFMLCLAMVAAPVPRLQIPIPRVTDPPPEIDGAGLRFSKLPSKIQIDAQENLAYSDKNAKVKWGGPEDSSGTVSFGWDNNCFYVFAAVRDDVFAQPNTGEDIFKGDHVMAVFDFQQDAPEDSSNVWKIGISPGDFDKLPPSAHAWSPLGVSASNVKCASVKTKDGYQLEVAIPWELFGDEVKPAVGVAFGFELYIGDSDNGITQKSMLSPSGKLGSNKPELLSIAVLATPDGDAPAALLPTNEFKVIPDIVRLAPTDTQTFEFEGDNLEQYHTMAIDALVEFEKYGGGTYGLVATLNGVPLDLTKSADRDELISFNNNTMASIGSLNNWFCFYDNDFNAKDLPNAYSAGHDLKPTIFKFAIDGILKPKEKNVLKIGYEPINRAIKEKLMVKAALTTEKSVSLMPDPAAELQEIVPHSIETHPDFTWQLQQDGSVTLGIGSHSFNITSRFSTTKPGWATFGPDAEDWESIKVLGKNCIQATTKDFAINRTVSATLFKITVTDNVTNLTSEPVPMMYSHIVDVHGIAYAKICGKKVSPRGAEHGPTYREEEPQRPTTMLCFKDASIGLVAEDDYTRAQGYNEVADTIGGLGNNVFVLPPNQTITLEYSAYPLENDDEFVWINRLRNDWNVNFTMHFGGTLASANDNVRISDEAVVRTLTSKLDTSRDVMVVGGQFHGTNILEIDTTELEQSYEKVHRLLPELQQLFYFHCFLSQSKYDFENLQDEAMLDSRGKQSNYDPRNFTEPLYTPIIGNEFAKRLEESFEKRLEMGYNIYWDEIERSCAKYDYNPRYWDGVTAEIDESTHQITRKMSTVTLVSLPWRVKMLNKYLPRFSNNGILGNGSPMTKTMMQFHFPRFIETGSISNLRLGQLFTPLSLGDHLTERREIDAYKDMVKALDYGSVYFWYSYLVRATHPTLTHYMFPITPVELGYGYIIGRERILTNKSGYFGWNDKSDFTTVVFDASGFEKPDFKIPRVMRDGHAFAEVRIPNGYSVAIIRK